MGLQELLHQALNAQRSGNLTQADRLYCAVLAIEPRNFDANHLIGIMRFQQGRVDEALGFLDVALQTAPDAAEALTHYGLVLHAAGRHVEALASLARALVARPAHAEALNHQGMVLRALGRPDAALASLDAALALEPDYGEALNNRAIVLRDMGRTGQALDLCDRAERLEPGNPEILFNRGLLLRDLGRCAEAAACFEKLLAIWLDHAAALNNLGLVLFECDRTDEAMQLFRRHAQLLYGSAPASADQPYKQQHDREQQAHLIGRHGEPGRRMARFHLGAGERLPGPAINPGNNIHGICETWRTARPQVVVIDDLLTHEALEGLRRFCWESTVWRKTYAGGYLGALPEHGFACPLLAQIADEFRSTYGGIFGPHHLRYLWGLKYGSALKGINIHADFAAVNVNFWITPD
ncbi:MAG: tetratricopeptide repeat protein [Pseudomonadota bacterium]